MNYFAISDTHFYHTNIIKYCNRPFKNVNEMNETIINNWNKVVNKEDTVFHLGDFAFEKDINKLITLRLRLNGNIIFILGNHDKLSIENYNQIGLNVVDNLHEEHILNSFWIFSHYQMTTWNCSHKGSFQLFGHEHWLQQYQPSHILFKEMEWSERKFNVCVDANNFTPINLIDIKNILEKREFNFINRKEK